MPKYSCKWEEDICTVGILTPEEWERIQEIDRSGKRIKISDDFKMEIVTDPDEIRKIHRRLIETARKEEQNVPRPRTERQQ